jgi:D-alanyl-lipoteichoic acid acyltransferase DltB (MBOAT superfamily)
MLFASFDFLLFFAPVLCGYWLLRGKPTARLWLLLFASYFFYMASGKPFGAELPTPWYFAGLLVISTLLDFSAGLFITKAQQQGGKGTLWLLSSLVGNLGLLGFFKYTGFLSQVGNDLSRAFGGADVLPGVQLLLPIGISFYTFQSLSYTIDVYRGRLGAERSLLRFALYVAFFPQLVAGPIVRAADFLPQFRQRLDLTDEALGFALFRISKGLFKKVVLGDFIAASFTDIVFSTPSDYSSLENLVALYAFTLQIYADFSGYSDIAIGVARLLGFQLPENFERPHQAADVGEFWRRWHMTLSSWLRDYLFFPLGGSRMGGTRAYVNLWITMFLVGMWHGASWNFVIYSNLHATAMLWSRWRRRRTGSPGRQLTESVLGCAAIAGLSWLFGKTLGVGEGLGPLVALATGTGLLLCALPRSNASRWLQPVHVLLMFHFTVLSRVFFRADSLERAREMVSRLMEFDGHGVRPGLFRVQVLSNWLESAPKGLSTALTPVAEQGLLILLVLGLGYHFTPATWTNRAGQRLFARTPGFALAVGFSVMLALMSQLLSGPRANIYFAF